MSIQVGSVSRGRVGLSLALCAAVASGARAEPATKPGPAPGSYTIENFRLESGVTLPRAIVVYGTYGTLDAAKDNAVLLPSHYMAQSDGYDWLIGEGRALDPRKHFQAVVGFSMGAEQAFQWAVSHPKFVDRIAATAGTARCWPHGVVRLDGQIRAITTDPAFKDGNYIDQPARGIETTGIVWLAWLYSQEWWKRELWKKTEPSAAHLTLAQYIEKQGKEFFAGADANDLILQMRTWQTHDVGTTPGFDGSTEKALRSIAVPVLYMPSETDLYFPLGDARQESKWIRKVTLAPIPSLWGHPAGVGATPEDLAFIERQLRGFLTAH